MVYAIGRPAVRPPHPHAVSKSIVYPPRQVNAPCGFPPFLHLPWRYPACGAIVIGLAAIIMSEVIFGRLFRNFALKLLAVVFGSILYFAIIALVLQLGLSTTDLKLFSALIVALFLAMPHVKARLFPQKTGGHKHA